MGNSLILFGDNVMNSCEDIENTVAFTDDAICELIKIHNLEVKTDTNNDVKAKLLKIANDITEFANKL